MFSGIFLPVFGSMWFVDLVAALLIGWGGVQDARTGEVSNWITIPIFVLGLAVCLFRVIVRDEIGFLSVFFIFLMTVFTWIGWMGGADWKVLCGLIGFWPQAAFMAIVCAGVWGIVEMARTRNRHARFPGIAAFAIGVGFFVIIPSSPQNRYLFAIRPFSFPP